ncbi:hypothetical protein KF728_09670 [Candidatus Obscuribacterales bacterium]|nr:hypothetical protein [Candidatus Obscuribacterales bacterium]
MVNQINHPYWELYSRLVALEAKYSSVSGRLEVLKLAQESEFSLPDTLKLAAWLACPLPNFGLVNRLFFCVLRERYAYSALSPVALDMLTSLSPLVELGAGNGYITWLLRQLGADIVALDAFPVEEGKNWFFNTKFGLPTKSGKSWTSVAKGDARKLVPFSNRTLLLCWPPKNSMAVDSLRYFEGPNLALIIDRTCCASKAFFIELQRNWNLEYSGETGSWSSCHVETLEIYTRKEIASC